MFQLNNNLFGYSNNNNYKNFGLSLNEFSQLGNDAIQLLKCEYLPLFNNPNATNEVDIIKEKYNTQEKVLILRKRK